MRWIFVWHFFQGSLWNVSELLNYLGYLSFIFIKVPWIILLPGYTIFGLPWARDFCNWIILCMFCCSRICSLICLATDSICFFAVVRILCSSSSSAWTISWEMRRTYRGTLWIGVIKRASSFCDIEASLSCWQTKASNSLLLFRKS